MLKLILISCGFLPLFLEAQPFVLPSLPYAYDAYAPQIDAQTMEIHLTKHHQAYVNNLNKELVNKPYEKEALESLMFGPSEQNLIVRNNAGGHYNHSLFWDVLAPPSSQGNASAALTQYITEAFGSMDSLKKALVQAASTKFGSGWAWLVLTPEKKLKVCATSNQDNPLMSFSETRGLPILGIDVWEHAYYLNYKNKRADYLNAVWSLLDWGVVSMKLEQSLNSPWLKRIEGDWAVLRKMSIAFSENQVLESSEVWAWYVQLQKPPKAFQQEGTIDQIKALQGNLIKLSEALASSKKSKKSEKLSQKIQIQMKALWDQ